MDDFTEAFSDLSEKRQDKILKLARSERQDAALNAVVMGLKELNQLYGFGLWRLSKLSAQWGEDIIAFYSGCTEARYAGEGLPADTIAGDSREAVAKAFPDLSDRRQRQIIAYVNQERQDAQWNATAIGLETIRKFGGFGRERTARLVKEWRSDLRNFYQDRDIIEPRLQAWIEEIGFLFQDGKLCHYRSNESGKIIRKRTAERQDEEDANADDT